MMRSTYPRLFPRAPLACALATLVWIPMMAVSPPAQANPGDTELVSVSPLTGASAQGRNLGNGDRYISADGRYVVFSSNAPDLVAGPWNAFRQLYVRDRGAGTTERITVSPSGSPGNADTTQWWEDRPSISADGRYVAFSSAASNLVAGDTNGKRDVFVRDRQTGSTERVSSSDGIAATGESKSASISADGRYVAFDSSSDIFVRDRQTGITTRISMTSGIRAMHISSPSISADGRYVAFIAALAEANGSYSEDSGMYVRDRQAGTTERVDVSSSGVRASPISFSSQPVISGDGRYVAFGSLAANLVPGDTNGYVDIYVRDRVAGTTERVSVSSTGVEANNNVYGPSISADGRYVAFDTAASLDPRDDDWYDVYVHDRQLRTTVLASVNSRGERATVRSDTAALSPDGRFVAFTSWSWNLGGIDTNDEFDVFVHEMGGPAPATFEFAVKPTALAFGNQALFTSTALSAWVTNKGTTALPIISVGVVGLNPGMFSINNRCGSSVAVGASCSVRVTFRPTSVGDKSAQLRIVAGDNDVRTKALAGTGVVSAFGVAPTSLDFGSVPINTTAPAKVVTISNTGNAALPISSITLGGWNPYQFAMTHNCPANLAVGATCTVNVVFKPTTPIGSKAALVNIASGGGAAIRSVVLAGAARR